MLAENSSNTSRLYHVAIPRPLRATYLYKLPETIDSNHILPGMRVRVPFGRTETVGILLDQCEQNDESGLAIREVIQVLDNTPFISAELLRLLTWAASYYHHPIGEVFETALPSNWQRPGTPDKSIALYEAVDSTKNHEWGRRQRQRELHEWLSGRSDGASRQEITGAGFSASLLRSLLASNRVKETAFQSLSEKVPAIVSRSNLLAEKPFELSDVQKSVLSNLELFKFQVHLIEGITGSGKTEIYLQAAAEVLGRGAQVLFLIPEIGLSPQTEQRIRSRLNCRIGIYHSGLSARQRQEVWAQARSGKLDLVLGTRSALFSPLNNLGLIVIDEEHDSSYKQQEGFRYSARDLAIVRAKNRSIPVIMGSATPSLESLKKAIDGTYRLHKLPVRVAGRELPQWQVIDTMKNPTSCGFSVPLVKSMSDHLSNGNQCLVFLNRRGFAPNLHCRDCGWNAECSGCDRPITLHQRPRRLLCHHCGQSQQVPACCPNCRSLQIEALGQGTERAEAFLQDAFPQTPVIRIDRDAVRKSGALKEMLDLINSKQPCIMLGTQMLAKGHHFPRVTLVAVVDADSGLFSADFRAIERTAQLITQVAGRAGRGEKPGIALLQSEHRDHPVLQQLISASYHELASNMLTEREERGLPPFSHMAVIGANSPNAMEAEQFLQNILSLRSGQPSDLQLLGPMPALMEKRRGRFRYQIQLTASKRSTLHSVLSDLIATAGHVKTSRSLRWSVDVDPQALD